jgi:hypothetical protein
MFPSDPVAFAEALTLITVAILSLVSSIVSLLGPFYQERRNAPRPPGASTLREEIDASNLPGWVKRQLAFRLPLNLALGLLLGACGLAVGILVVWPRSEKGQLGQHLERFDQAVFQGISRGSYDVARVFPDEVTLKAEARMGEILHGTRHSFDLLAGHGLSVVGEFRGEIEAAVLRGVSVRVALMDPTPANKTAIELGASATGLRPDVFPRRVNESLGIVAAIRQQLLASKNQSGGSIEARLHRGPLLFSLWIKDGKFGDAAVANVSVSKYRDPGTGRGALSFRLSGRTADRSITEFVRQFDAVWATAERVP